MFYEDYIKENSEWIDEIWQRLDRKLSRTAASSFDKIPYTTKNGVHDSRDGEKSYWWTNGFWGGLMWLMYAGTQKECYRLTAERSEKKMDTAFGMIDRLHHDVGFMWHIMSGASYRLTGNSESRTRNLIAAMMLASRYNITGDYIRAWNANGDETKGWSIIDCMMNIPLLYWASDETGDDRFKKIAMRHADMSMRDHVRADGSVNHIVVHNPNTPEVLEVKAGQGYASDSCWSRGSAWALYGFILSYIHTREERYLDTAKKVANYFIANVSENNWLPLCDFRQPEIPVLYDSTAGTIAACGLIEIAKNVPDGEQKLYFTAALNMLKAMEKNWCNWEENEDAVLQMGTERYIEHPTDGQRGVHIPIIYGDYFFAEAIFKLKGFEFLPW